MQELKTGLVHLLSSAAVSAGKQSRPKTNKQSCSTIFQFPPLKHKLTKLSSFMTFFHECWHNFVLALTQSMIIICLHFARWKYALMQKKCYAIKYLIKEQVTSFLWKLLSCDSGVRRAGEWVGARRALTWLWLWSWWWS